MEPQDGSDETRARQDWSDSTSVNSTKSERDGAFPALGSFIQSSPGHRDVEDG